MEGIFSERWGSDFGGQANAYHDHLLVVLDCCKVVLSSDKIALLGGYH